MVQPAFIVIDEYGSGDMHGVDERQTFSDPTVLQALLNLRRDVDKSAPGGHLEPKFASVAFHTVSASEVLLLSNHATNRRS